MRTFRSWSRAWHFYFVTTDTPSSSVTG